MTATDGTPPSSPTGPVGIVYAIALILSACSLLYELLIAQTLTLIVGNMVIWYSLTVGIYLAAMGLGAVLYGAAYKDQGWTILYQVEILLCAVGGLAVILLQFAHTMYLYQSVGGTVVLSALAFFGLSFVITFLIGILTGLELPLLMQLANEVAAGRNVTNRVLGWDYIGALVGGIVFPLFLLPHFELLTIGFITATVNLLVAAYIVLRFIPRGPGLALRMASSAVFGLLLVAGYFSGGRIEQYFLRKYYYYNDVRSSPIAVFAPMNDMPHVFRASSPYQKIDLLEDPDRTNYDILINAYSTKFVEDPSKLRNRFLFLNGDFQVGSNYEEIYHEWFAHVPIIVNGHVPERVLVMGGGDGCLIRELLKYDSIRNITHVDIDHELVRLAKVHPILTNMNEHSLESPRVHTQFGDAFQFIRNSRETFDAIYLDFPYAKDYNVAKLYSREFYHFVMEHLSDHGYVVFDAPGVHYFNHVHADGKKHVGNGGNWGIHYNTIRQAGFRTILAYYTVLEHGGNPRALEILESSDLIKTVGEDLTDPKEKDYEKKRWMRNFATHFAERIEQTFLLMRKDEIKFPPAYRDFGIKLHVLNEERFGLSFRLPPDDTKVDLSKVNSILRPTLPRGRMWTIRDPW